MSKDSYVIGVDPDTKKHGVAIYENGKLTRLSMMESYPLAILAQSKEAIVFIEDVMSNQFVYGRNAHKSKSAQSKIAMRVGRCQQAQVELVRLLHHLEVVCKAYKPQVGNWAKNKALFQNVTGWQGTSNEDTRSAAYFGHLGLNWLQRQA